MNFFVWIGTIKILDIKNKSTEKAITITIIFLFILPILNFIVKEFLGTKKIIYYTNYISYFWLFFVFYLTILYSIALPIKGIFKNSILFKIIPFALLFFVTIYGLNESKNIVKKIIKIKAKVKKTYKIAFFADIHFEALKKEENYRRVYKIIESEKPDLILIGGDTLEKESIATKEPMLWLKKLSDVAPMIAILGNHDIYAGKDKSIEYLKKSGIKPLVDSGYDFEELYIFGFDERKRGFSLRVSEKELNLFSPKKEKFNIALIHKPISIDEISKKGANLILAGHVHKGQFFPFSLFVRLGFKYFYGEYKKGRTTIYVTSGAGTWGPPIRILAKPEVVFFKITGENE